MYLIWIAAAALAAAAPAAARRAPANLAAPASPAVAVEQLLAADRAWSQASAGTDLVSGISAMLDERVVMPLPNGGFARSKPEVATALRANPANTGARATWRPVRAGVSADGRHGFSFGYMTIEQRSKPPRYAKYLSYWVKRADGWRIAAYKRVPSPSPDGTSPLAPLAPARLITAAAGSVHLDQLRQGLIAAERGFSDEAQTIGLGPAFKRHGRADSMNMGRESAFLIGAEAIGGSMPPDPKSPVHWSAEDAIVAASGDLGVTWGLIKPHGKPPEGQPAAIPFFTIWYRDDPSQPWKYVAE